MRLSIRCCCRPGVALGFIDGVAPVGLSVVLLERCMLGMRPSKLELPIGVVVESKVLPDGRYATEERWALQWPHGIPKERMSALCGFVAADDRGQPADRTPADDLRKVR
jgi:hypothetical protein